MFESITIKNFRAFEDLTIAPLARVNLIAGSNNTGKTSVLEAIYLHVNPNDCQLVLNVNARGALNPKSSEVMNWIFHRRDTSLPVAIDSIDLCRRKRSTKIWITDGTNEAVFKKINTAHTEFVHQVGDRSSSMKIVAIEHQETDSSLPANDLNVISAMFIKEKGGGSVEPGMKQPKSEFLSSSLSSENNEDVKNYSRLDEFNRTDEVLKDLVKIEPRLKRLSIVVDGNKPTIHADIGLGRLMPVALAGEGMRRYLSIILAILNCPQGVVLIDEIENGLHHSVMETVWKAIGLAAREADVQVFATTHSYECIQAAHHAFDKNKPYDFRLHRLERNNERLTPDISFDPLGIDS